MFSQRSPEKELIDLGPEYYTPAEYKHCMKKMFLVNQLLGFFHSTIHIIKKIPAAQSLLDIGCGNGLFLLNLGKYFPAMKCQGVDICPEAIRLAQQELCKRPNALVSFQLQKNHKLSLPENSMDIVLMTLVCHHLTDEQLVVFLQDAFLTARKVVIINDLHRHFLAYWLYGFISPILFRNRLITHDGLISIKRSFTRKDWQTLLTKTGIKKYKIQWRFPFRWSVTLWKE